MSMLQKMLRKIDLTSNRVGKSFAWCSLIIVVIITYDVAMRYLFSKPTVWQFDMSWMLGGVLYLVSVPYVIMTRKQIRVDALYSRFSKKTQLLIDIVLTICLFFPLRIALVYFSIGQAWHSVAIRETSSITYWRPIVYPFIVAVTIFLFLTLVQGASTFIQTICSLKHLVSHKEEKVP